MHDTPLREVFPASQSKHMVAFDSGLILPQKIDTQEVIAIVSQ